MALNVTCSVCGHTYVQADRYVGKWPRGMPYCPNCAKEWRQKQGSYKKEVQWEKYASVKCAFCGVLLRFEEAKLGSDGRFYCESCNEGRHHTGHKKDYE